MKNIHVLPTDKPSRLSILNNGKLNFGAEFISSSNAIAQHIYITSDEEIKEGVNQWYLDKVLNKPYNSGGAQYSSKQDVIILTTDQDLIKDGVQVIDDEFLEWFVKNQSCEEVEIERWTDYKLKNNEEVIFFNYKIIIPKEKLSTKLHKGEIVDESYPKEFKQETLEEVAEIWVNNRFTKQIKDEDIYASKSSIIESHILFAKWQQERSYSEEDVKNAFLDGWQLRDGDLPFPKAKKKWFNKFKNK
jgi:hypothetical protein